MSPPLDVHVAGSAEKLEAFRNVHDVWGRGLSVEEHLARRLRSVQHNRARWYVGTLGGRVVTSLGVYPIALRLHGAAVDGFAIGAVHTLAGFRGQGLARQLIAQVERMERDNGAELAMLFSDIGFDYYARQGYVPCDSWDLVLDLGDDWKHRQGACSLREVEAAAVRERMEAMYREHHSRFAVGIERSAEYWNYLLAKSSDDQSYLVGDASGDCGYVRVIVDGNEAMIRDYALIGERRLLAPLVAAVARLVDGTTVRKLTGWLPPAPDLDGVLRPREIELTMLKSLSERARIDDAVKKDAANLCEIDHV